MRTILISAALIAALNSPAVSGGLPDPVDASHFGTFDMDEVRLGRDLFYDRILSGNKNIACSTCHHPKFATSDGLSLGLGEGGIGLGPERKADPENLPEQRIPRNSPALFNLGSPEFTVMFHDGRIEADPSRTSGLRTPLEDDMVAGFDNILSAQTMFPVLSPDEMAGHYQENELSKLVRQGRLTGPGGAWDAISSRVSEIDAYELAFQHVYPEIAAGKDIGFTDISNAIAAFISFEWMSIDSPFDAHLRGESNLPDDAMRGMALFYGEAGCSSCHSGSFQTDHDFHAMRQPQFGPGKAERFESHQRDIGRQRVTGLAEDAYAFRTPSLRNVAKTGPWGHTGAYTDLGAFLKHHTNDDAGFDDYPRDVVLPELKGAKDDWAVMDDPTESTAILAAATTFQPDLTEDQIEDLLAFLDSLTDPVALEGRLGVPDAVPSGLPIDR